MTAELEYRYAEEVADARRVARPLVVALALSGLVNAALVVAVADVTAAGSGSSGAWDRFGGLITAGAFLVPVTGLLWLRWFVDVYDAARTAGRATYPRFWAWATWLIPVVNLFVPFLLVREVWRVGGDGERLPGLCWVWWALWVVGAAGSWPARDPMPPELTVVALVATALAAPFAIAVVRALTARIEPG